MRKSVAVLAFLVVSLAPIVASHSADDLESLLLEAVVAGDVNLVTTYLNLGAKIEAANEAGATALMWAALKGDLPMVKLLIDRGANVNAKTFTGATALKGASIEGHLSVVKALVEAGADVKIKDNQGKTASEAAKAQGKGAIAAYLNGLPTQTGRASSASPQQGRIEGVVVRVDQPDNCLRIRKGPGTNHEKLGCVGLNETVILTGTVQGGWAELIEPTSGWATLSQIRAEGLSPPKQTSTVQKPRRSPSQDEDGGLGSTQEAASGGGRGATQAVGQEEPSGQAIQINPGISIGPGGGIQFGPGGGGFGISR